MKGPKKSKSEKIISFLEIVYPCTEFSGAHLPPLDAKRIIGLLYV